VQFFARPPVAVPDGHAGYVAGRYRNGVYSDVWTDVRRCAERTFTAYAAGCSCGWRGAPTAPTEVGYHLACRAWLQEHAERLTATGVVGVTGAVPSAPFT
jgi:hypothetical protein